MSECIHCEGHGWNMERVPDGVSPERYKCEHCNGSGENKVSAPINDGGPAFPLLDLPNEHHGMTLRDYFAAKAMSVAGIDLTNANNIAEFSYQIADAMIAARGRCEMSDTPRTDSVMHDKLRDGNDLPNLARELERELAAAKKINQQSCEDWAHDHTRLQNLCREVGFSEHDVEGDKYGIRAITQLGDMLRSKVAELERENARLRIFIQSISHQKPEKPDYWNTCGQCERNIDDAHDALCQSQTPTNDRQGA